MPIKKKKLDYLLNYLKLISNDQKKCELFHDAFKIKPSSINETGILTKNFMCCHPLLRVPYKHPPNKILCTFRYARPGFRNEVKFSFQNLLKYSLFRFWSIYQPLWIMSIITQTQTQTHTQLKLWKELTSWNQVINYSILTIPKWGNSTE